MNNDFWFALSIMVLVLGNLLDVISTRVGIWNYELTEGNPLYKFLPASVQKFFFLTPFGSFVDGGLRLALVCVLVTALGAVGHVQDRDSWLPLAIAAGSFYVTVKNGLFILKQKKAGHISLKSL